MNIEYYREQLLAKEDMLARTTQYLLETQDKLIKKSDLIAGVNQSLFESIGFANLIQTALLPDVSILKTKVQDAAYHVINQIGIGGDSVFIKETEDGVAFGLLDATGHGIPAAMLSISGLLILAELLVSPIQKSPAEIMKELNGRLHSTFNKDRSIAHLEGTLLKYFPTEKILSYCCAKGKGVLITKSGELRDLSCCKFSIGEDTQADYELRSLNCNPGDKLFLYSDGLTDQFGGNRNKKFTRRRLKDLLITNSRHSAGELSEIIYNEHKEWRGEYEQTDDISFMIITF